MRTSILFFKKPYRYTIFALIVLVLFTAYVFLDTFYIPKVFIVLDDSPVDFADLIEAGADDRRDWLSSDSDGTDAEEIDEEIYVEPGVRLVTYADENIDLTIEQYEGEGGHYYVADIKLSSINYFRTALYKGTLGTNIKAPTSVIAKENNALFAISGDYAGFNELGVIMRNGQLLRVAPREDEQYGLVVDIYGDFLLIPEMDLTEEKLREVHAIHCFSFGPTLVAGGGISISESPVSKNRHPRTALGQKGPLHYIFIVTDGRSDKSRIGMLFPELAEEFAKRGCTAAYNLDGGGTSTMWFDGEVINTPSTDGAVKRERSISDIIFIPKNE